MAISEWGSISTPAYVNQYARKLWKHRDLRFGDQGKDLRKRAFQRLQAFSHACSFKQKDYSVGFYTTVDKYVPLPTRSNTNSKVATDSVTIASVKDSKISVSTYLARQHSKFVTIPYTDFWMNGDKSTHIVVHKRNSLRVVFGETSTQFIASKKMQDYVKECKGLKTLIFPVGYVKSHGKDGPTESHATVMMYLFHNKNLYFLDPESGWSALGSYVNEHAPIIRTVFRQLFDLPVKEIINTLTECPYIAPVQRAELNKGSDLKGLCVLWSLMLMTQYLEYSKDRPKSDPLDFVKNGFKKSQHPFVQLNQYLRSLYPNRQTPQLSSKKRISALVRASAQMKSTTKNKIPTPKRTSPNCKSGLVFELGKCRTPCPVGSVRSEDTKRCRKQELRAKVTFVQNIQKRTKPNPKCKPTQELVNARCLKKCDPTQVRNPVTSRCKKKT